MQTILSLISQLYIYMAVVPFVSFAIIWGVSYWLTRDKKRSILRAMDLTTFFLIGSISVMSRSIFDTGLGFWGVLFMFLAVGAFLANLQERLKGRMNLYKIVRMLLRGGFVVLSILYVILLFVGISKFMSAT